ncbi:hypothetical protein G3R49_10095 [Shewanella sp. WXL01]|uniref:DUF6776 family protein n=1 Tax=Shewanella sp. WXL01 TaxID=2709721 RepID=UPI00143858B8|nr:DUF6776 family protein [Shewanella sp. WXL01]NKF50911.1 hypothetical protein [Shewanella sp. WXL01]
MLNYHRWLDRLQVFERKSRSSSFYLLSLMCVAFLLGGSVYNVAHDWEEVQEHQEDQQKLELERQIKSLNRELANIKLTLGVAQQANTSMRQMFNEQVQKQQELETELKFYRSLMVPDDSVDGIGIHALELSHGMLPDQFKLRLILTQLQKRKQQSKAQAFITLVGIEQGEAKQIDLGELVDNKFEFDFKYFQVADSEFNVPEDFNLQRIEVRVKVKARRGVKGGETFATFHVPELLQGEKEQRVILEQNSQVKDNPEQ